MAERPSDWKGDAFLLVNSYTTVRTNLEPLIQIDEAIRDFWETFHALHIWPVVRWNLTKDELGEALKLWDVTLSRQATKFVVFYFIGHGGDGDVLFMEDGEPVTTEEIVANFHPVPKEIYKFFFIDACRRTDECAQPLDRAYCPSLENSLLARSTLPYQAAYTGGTYGRPTGTPACATTTAMLLLYLCMLWSAVQYLSVCVSYFCNRSPGVYFVPALFYSISQLEGCWLLFL